MNWVFCVLVFLVLVKVGSSLMCYSCEEDTCNHRKQWRNVTGCGESLNQIHQTGACLKEVYKADNATKEMTVRKCIIAEKKGNGMPYHKCTKDQAKIVSCEVCTTDFCNSAHPISSCITILAGAFIAFILLSEL